MLTSEEREQITAFCNMTLRRGCPPPNMDIREFPRLVLKALAALEQAELHATELDTVKSAGKKMRNAQKDYFRSRSHSDLIQSKEFEKRFDEILNKPARTETQGSLV